MVSEKGIVHIGESTDVGRNWIDVLLVGKKKFWSRFQGSVSHLQVVGNTF